MSVVRWPRACRNRVGTPVPRAASRRAVTRTALAVVGSLTTANVFTDASQYPRSTSLAWTRTTGAPSHVFRAAATAADGAAADAPFSTFCRASAPLRAAASAATCSCVWASSTRPTSTAKDVNPITTPMVTVR